MIDQTPHPALFMHIQKTAGTSIVNTARKHYGTSVTSHGDCWGKTPDSLDHIRFISGHIGYDYAKALMPNRFSFVFLRSPAERILSMYYFCKSRNSNEFKIYEKASTLNLEEFLIAGQHDPWVKKNIWNNQVWQLAHGYAHLDERTISCFSDAELLELALKHVEKFDFVGLTETYDSDKDYILTSLGIPSHSGVRTDNVTNGRPIISEIPPRCTELLHQLTELDVVLYEKIRQQKHGRILQTQGGRT